MNYIKHWETKGNLSLEEREIFGQLGKMGEAGGICEWDMDIRHGLTSVLGEMGNAMQMLLHLLDRYSWDCPKSEQPTYNMLLQNITEAAISGYEWVQKSRELDQSALLALTSAPSVWMQ